MQRFVRASGIVADAVLVAAGVTAPANAATATALGAPAILSLNGARPYADLLPDGTVRLYFPSSQLGRTAVA